MLIPLRLLRKIRHQTSVMAKLKYMLDFLVITCVVRRRQHAADYNNYKYNEALYEDSLYEIRELERKITALKENQQDLVRAALHKHVEVVYTESHDLVRVYVDELLYWEGVEIPNHILFQILQDLGCTLESRTIPDPE